MRGEYSKSSAICADSSGSPPLAWGIPLNSQQTASFSGITPTCVGNTRKPSGRWQRFEDHPHLRGEYPTLCTSHSIQAGSPPLAWGIPNWKGLGVDGNGITPTCVGNTGGGTAIYPSDGDHPHLRGEYQRRNFGPPGLSGSPPLAWGIPKGITGIDEKMGITPTCVGNTCRLHGFHKGQEDHPHLRGEYSLRSKTALRI